jgi:DNA primase
MGTAVTQEQVSELARGVGAEGRVSIALDADRSGQEAMLRAAKIARERQVQLRVVRMPEGQDPADLVRDEGAEAMRTRLGQSVSVLEFEVGRVLDDADLDSPEATDRALVAVRELIAEAPPQSKVRDNLVRLAADRLDVPVDYVISVAEAPTPKSGEPVRHAGAASPHKAEVTYLARCVSAGALGREALDRLIPEHLPSASLRRARDHLLAHPDDPQAAVPTDDAALALVIDEVVGLAETMTDTDREALRTDYLLLERTRLEREVSRARSEGDPRQSELSRALQQVKTEMGTAMGQAT